MANRLEAYAHLAGQTLRTGWYVALQRFISERASRLGAGAPRHRRSRPFPGDLELFGGAMRLLKADADNVRDGIYPPLNDDDGSPLDYIDTVRRLLADLPRIEERRLAGRAEEAAMLPEAANLPQYYTRNFHYQTDGYLSEDSAKLYDIQVETLFLGAGGAMRRQALRPIAEFIRGRDQRGLALLDAACGTGRFLGQVAQAFPALPLTGVDLSFAYAGEARRYLAGKRYVKILQANAEALPLPGASQDIAICIFLYHELPQEVRRTVTAEIARVLKPGGLFVFIDSLQWGDKPGYDGLLEAFPIRFHEPYYENYLGDDLSAMFSGSGLTPVQTWTAFLSKVIACRKT